MMKDKITILSSHKLLCASGKFFLYCKGSALYKQKSNGGSEEYIGSVPGKFIFRLFSKSHILCRLFRLEPRCGIFTDESTALISIHGGVYRVDLEKGGIYIAQTSEGGCFCGGGAVFPAYGITKTAANKTVRTLRSTVDDVNIIAMHPGRMNTDMGRTTAQIEPEEAAAGICEILEGKRTLRDDEWFVDYLGRKMPLQ